MCQSRRPSQQLAQCMVRVWLRGWWADWWATENPWLHLFGCVQVFMGTFQVRDLPRPSACMYFNLCIKYVYCLTEPHCIKSPCSSPFPLATTVMSRAQNDTVANTIRWRASYALVPWFPIGTGGYRWVLKVTNDDWWFLMRKRSGNSRRPSPMSGNSEVVGGVVGKTRKSLHEDGTGRQLDFTSEYYRLWPSYLYYYRKNYGSI